jgi:hypothetical protein
MYARKRERTELARRARTGRLETSGAPPLGQPDSEPVG